MSQVGRYELDPVSKKDKKKKKMGNNRRIRREFSPGLIMPGRSAGSAVEAPVSMPALGNRPLAMNPQWQARFNKLLDKSGTSPAQAASSVESVEEVPTYLTIEDN
jgi:hypothetical protein